MASLEKQLQDAKSTLQRREEEFKLQNDASRQTIQLLMEDKLRYQEQLEQLKNQLKQQVLRQQKERAEAESARVQREKEIQLEKEKAKAKEKDQQGSQDNNDTNNNNEKNDVSNDNDNENNQKADRSRAFRSFPWAPDSLDVRIYSLDMAMRRVFFGRCTCT